MARRLHWPIASGRNDPTLALVREGETRHPKATYWVSIGGIRYRVSQRLYEWLYRNDVLGEAASKMSRLERSDRGR